MYFGGIFLQPLQYSKRSRRCRYAALECVPPLISVAVRSPQGQRKEAANGWETL